MAVEVHLQRVRVDGIYLEGTECRLRACMADGRHDFRGWNGTRNERPQLKLSRLQLDCTYPCSIRSKKLFACHATAPHPLLLSQSKPPTPTVIFGFQVQPPPLSVPLPLPVASIRLLSSSEPEPDLHLVSGLRTSSIYRCDSRYLRLFPLALTFKPALLPSRQSQSRVAVTVNPHSAHGAPSLVHG